MIDAKKVEEKLWTSGDTWIQVSENDLRKYPEKDFVRIKKNGRWYVTTKAINAVENEIAHRIIIHLHSKQQVTVDEETAKRLISEYEKLEGDRLNIDFHFSFYQAEAIKCALNHQFMVLTGGPGTGKTCVVKGIVYALEHTMDHPNIVFTAPTGKAARRMEESIGKSASTVQKRMHLTDINASPQNITGDVIIIDEVSMLDELTMDTLVCALEKGIKIIFVGDTDQLPSVGFGSVLRDMMFSAVLPVVKLEAPQRQKAGSNIYENICTIRKGNTFLTEGDDFKMILANDDNGQKLLVDTYMEMVETYGVDQTVVLTPYRRKGKTCANVINDIIQAKFNPPTNRKSVTAVIREEKDNESPKKTFRKITFVEGDPVMQLKNRAEVSNGDVGRITEICDEGITVKYGDITVFYWRSEFSQLNLAYAMSVHKSQGSEYKCVITCALPEHKDLVSRNLVYTAVTRSKGICVMIYDMETLKTGLTREAAFERTTMLSEKIEQEELKYRLILAAFRYSASRYSIISAT